MSKAFRRLAAGSAAAISAALFLPPLVPVINAGNSGGAAVAAEASRPGYAALLDQALTEMEAGRHADALTPLKAALGQERNEATGLLTLGTLYLHTGSPVRAAAEFQRARALAPNEPLTAWGVALSALAQNRKEEASAALATLPPQEVAAAPLLSLYVRLLSGDAAGVRAETASVTADETDPLRLQIAAFAALRSGNGHAARGEALMTSLLSRPKMARLAEDRALVLPFLPNVLAEGGAPSLPTAIGFPAAPGGKPLAGRVTLSPGNLPDGVSFVTYALEGGGFTASTNYPPFTADWNTSRVSNGLHTLRITFYDAHRRILKETNRTLVISNAGAAPSRHIAPEEARELRARIRALLLPRPSRKAAHFALAERAAARSDSETALKHIESVVAIDPLYQNARISLRRYHRAVLGPREGIWKATTKEKIVALTFDDGPNPLPYRTPALLDALKTANVPATFFVVGVRAEESPQLLRRMMSEGHEIANHSYSHPNLTLMNAVAIERELGRTSVIVRDATGKRPRFYRPPGGNVNRDVVVAAEALGMAGAYWTLDGLKYEGDSSTPARLTQYVVKNIEPGAIILLHNAPRTTIAAIPAIVRELRARGYTMVTMSELVQRTRGAAAKR